MKREDGYLRDPLYAPHYVLGRRAGSPILNKRALDGSGREKQQESQAQPAKCECVEVVPCSAVCLQLLIGGHDDVIPSKMSK
jgi:hypothetical protein